MTARVNSSGTALVAGGAGFLGSYLCERLIAEGWRVICVDNLHTGTLENLSDLSRESRFSLIEADITKPLPRQINVDRIYNLACPASPRHYQADPVHTLLTNVVGMRNLLELARTNEARILQTSTSEVYGDPAEHPQNEAYWGNVNPTGIRACYDEGKRAAETLCFDYKRRHGVSVRVARVFNTYGPRMRPDDGRIVSNLVVQAISGMPHTIYGSGEQTRSFCYVSDLIEGLSRLIALDQEIDMPINLGNPEEFSINELAALVRTMTGSASEVSYFPLPSDDPRCRRPDISRAKALLDWVPVVPVRQGIQATIDWFAGRQGGKLVPAQSDMIAAD
jgi:UDP-glucuronate decarboxylase